LHSLGIGTVQLAVIAAYEAFKRLFIRELLLDLGFVLQALVASLDDVCSVNALPNHIGKLVKLVQAFFGAFKDSCKLRIALSVLR
jgi:hypothetical protein